MPARGTRRHILHWKTHVQSAATPIEPPRRTEDLRARVMHRVGEPCLTAWAMWGAEASVEELMWVCVRWTCQGDGCCAQERRDASSTRRIAGVQGVGGGDGGSGGDCWGRVGGTGGEGGGGLGHGVLGGIGGT